MSKFQQGVRSPAYFVKDDGNQSPLYGNPSNKDPIGSENLTPYASLGVTISDLDPLHRYSINVESLSIELSPYTGALLNLDTTQLYTANPSTNNKFGTPYEAGAVVGSNCYDRYGTSDGVYSSPLPIKGAPVEFRKVYFRGQEVDSQGKTLGCVSGSPTGACGTYFAYFACSQPVQQTCKPSDGDESGCAYNPRNENFGMQDGVVVDWDSFDIGCEGGTSTSSGGCNDVYSMVSGSSGSSTSSSASASGCNSILEFAGIGLDVSVTGNESQSTSTVTYSLDACYSTVIAVTSGSLYTGQSPYREGQEYQTGFCTIQTVKYATLPEVHTNCCGTTSAPPCSEKYCVSNIPSPNSNCNGTYDKDTIINGRDSYIKALGAGSNAVLSYNGANWQIYNELSLSIVDSAKAGSENCPDTASWPTASVVQGPESGGGLRDNHHYNNYYDHHLYYHDDDYDDYDDHDDDYDDYDDYDDDYDDYDDYDDDCASLQF